MRKNRGNYLLLRKDLDLKIGVRLKIKGKTQNRCSTQNRGKPKKMI